MPIKVALFQSNYSVGGAERQYGYLIDTINRERFDVHVVQISHRSSRPNATLHPTATIKTFEMRHKLDVLMLFRIASYIRRNRIDLIQSQLFMDNQIARAVGFLSRRPVISSVRGGPTLGWLRTRVEHGFQWMSKRVVVNSQWLKGILVKDGVRSEKIVVIHNGIDPERFRSSADKTVLRGKYRIDPGTKVIGIVARLHPMKDHKTFFDVVGTLKVRIPDIRAIVAGDGSIRGELEHYVDQIGIRENVIFLGTVGRNLPEVLRVMDVLLLTSRWGESLPNALLEAMSAGVPVVAANMHGVPEIVEDDVNGYLVETGDTKRMAERVMTLLMNKEIRERIIGNATKTVEEFGIPGMVRKYEELYEQVVAETR
jgi:glycosyltransferase involved in cell wall biosynthesis